MGDRPLIFSEFYFSSTGDSGLTGGGKDVSSQWERGLAYRHYVEQAAALGYVVGIEWFTLVDQATTGRWFEKYNGEAANTGLITVTDRPWQAMLAEMMKTNYGIEFTAGRSWRWLRRSPGLRVGPSECCR